MARMFSEGQNYVKFTCLFGSYRGGGVQLTGRHFPQVISIALFDWGLELTFRALSNGGGPRCSRECGRVDARYRVEDWDE